MCTDESEMPSNKINPKRDIRIGTSGYHYRHWIGRYYPAGTKPNAMLAHYLLDFDTVELNNTFYRLPTQAAVDSWRDSVPPGFLYAVKGSRFITHRIKLKDAMRGLSNFIPLAESLGKTLGPFLWQLPPRWKVNAERLEEFLALLPSKHRHAFEFRDQSWMTDAVLETLQRHNAAFCIYELAGYRSPLELTADWTYVRLHGPTTSKYQGSYSEDALAEWAGRIRAWSRRLRAVYLYFDNDDSAYAVENALTLKRMLGKLVARRAASA